MAAAAISLFLGGSGEATLEHRHAPHGDKLSWDGVWSGSWGGQESQATAVTIVNNNVVSFEYHGMTTPVSASAVTPTTVSYVFDGISVRITRTSVATATASLHSPMGDATARLTRQ
jgi:hypothetical protein